MMTEVEHAGDVDHPDHQQWLLALGRASFASQLLAGIAVDVLRVHCSVNFWTLLPDTLGNLIKRLENEDQRPVQIPGLTTWLVELDQALTVRNDLAHALPVKHGLHRRTAKDRSRVVNFFDVEDLDAATATLTAARVLGNMILYHDGGKAVAAATTS